MHNQFKSQKFKHLMLAMGPRDLNSAPYSPVHCSSHSLTSFQSSELTELPVVENGQLFAQRAHSACTARAQRTVRPQQLPRKNSSPGVCVPKYPQMRDSGDRTDTTVIIPQSRQHQQQHATTTTTCNNNNMVTVSSCQPPSLD